jgi:hypothetical protein
MNEALLLADCLKRLNALRIDYYVTGSMASNYWGIPRTTHDLDFVIRITPSAVKPLVDAFSADFYIDEGSVRASFNPPYQFNAIDTRSALKVDFWLPRPTAFDQEMLSRRVLERIGDIPAWLATAEDVILHKLVWNQITPSDRQLRDAAGVWAVQSNRLDMDYLKKWSAQLGVAEQLDKIFNGEIRPKST